jgi:hypothetical protein
MCTPFLKIVLILIKCLERAMCTPLIWRAEQDPWFSPNTFTNIKLFKVMSEEWTKHGNDSWMQILFFEIYKRGNFNVQGTRHSPNTLPTMVLGQNFMLLPRRQITRRKLFFYYICKFGVISIKYEII